jgi:hypothetical protein
LENLAITVRRNLVIKRAEWGRVLCGHAEWCVGGVSGVGDVN